jgi:hypothetical protein
VEVCYFSSSNSTIDEVVILPPRPLFPYNRRSVLSHGQTGRFEEEEEKKILSKCGIESRSSAVYFVT